METPKPSPEWGRWRTDIVRAPRGRNTTPIHETAKLRREEQDTNDDHDND